MTDMTAQKDEQFIEQVAQFLHDEGGFDEAWTNHTWPEHSEDTGRRDGGFVKIVPADVQAKFRDIARRLVTGFCLSPTPTTEPDSGMVEKLREIKDAARYVPVGAGFFDPYARNIEAVDAAVDRALSALQPQDAPAGVKTGRGCRRERG